MELRLWCGYDDKSREVGDTMEEELSRQTLLFEVLTESLSDL
jgi:hypothetical protein